jgi:hypothetical protein
VSVNLVKQVLAQAGSPQPTIGLGLGTGQWAPLSQITASGMVAAGIRFLLVITALVFFFFLLSGGIQWITSGGDKAQTEAARNRLTAAIIGLVIVFVAWAIINLISMLFGINLLNLNIEPIPGITPAP